jgi:hypothetical protein
MDSNNTFPQINDIKLKLSSENNNTNTSKNDLKLTMSDIRNLAVLKFGGVNAFGRALGVTSGLASRLLSGDYIPLKPETIHRIADCLGVDAVTLTQIYSKKNAGDSTNGSKM